MTTRTVQTGKRDTSTCGPTSPKAETRADRPRRPHIPEHSNLTGNATNVTPASRAPLVAAAKRHNMPAIAVMGSTPVSVCVERQGPRPVNRTVPDDTVRAQHTAMVRSHPKLLAEGFNDVFFSDSLCQLLLPSAPGRCPAGRPGTGRRRRPGRDAARPPGVRRQGPAAVAVEARLDGRRR
ncbi:AAA family ATPase [Streptomyces goshikiensis]